MLAPKGPQPCAATSVFQRSMAKISSEASLPQAASPSSAEALWHPSDHQYAYLVNRTPTPALTICSTGVCPWCVLCCRHGDVSHALAQFRVRRSQLLHTSSRGRFMLEHCRLWILELAAADAAGTLTQPSVYEETATAALPKRFSTRLPPASSVAAGTSSASHWLGAGPVAAASSSTPPPPPVCPPSTLPPPPGLALPESAAPSDQPPNVGASWLYQSQIDGSYQWVPRDIWQFWAGKRTKWQAYSLGGCAALSHMALHGPFEHVFSIEERRYCINVRDLTQKCLETDGEARVIRIQPVEEAD